MNTIKELQKSLVNIKKEIKTILKEELCFPENLFDERIIENKDDTIEEPLIPLLTYRENEKYVIVDGCKRYFLSKRSLDKELLCIVLNVEEPQEIIDIKKYGSLLRIFINSTRKLDLLEKILFIKWLKRNVSGSLYKEFCFLLNIDNRERYELENLGECDFSVISAIKNNSLDISVAIEVNRMDKVDRDAIISFWGTYSFSKQMQRELVDILSELAFRERCNIKDILELEEIKKIESNSKLNNPQKIEKIRNFLFERRFPLVAKAKKEWAQKVSAINPYQSNIHFKPSEAFEKDFLEIRINITSAKMAKDIFKKLNEISEEQWEEIIYPC